MISADRELRRLRDGTALCSWNIGDVAFLDCNMLVDITRALCCMGAGTTDGVKMVGRIAVAALEAAHRTIVFGRGPAVAVEAGEGLVELSGLGRHCDDRTMVLSVKLKETRANRWVIGWSDPGDCFVFPSALLAGRNSRLQRRVRNSKSRLDQGPQNFWLPNEVSPSSSQASR